MKATLADSAPALITRAAPPRSCRAIASNPPFPGGRRGRVSLAGGHPTRQGATSAGLRFVPPNERVLDASSGEGTSLPSPHTNHEKPATRGGRIEVSLRRNPSILLSRSSTTQTSRSYRAVEQPAERNARAVTTILRAANVITESFAGACGQRRDHGARAQKAHTLHPASTSARLEARSTL